MFDRTTALVGKSDTGIVRWRRLLEDQIAAVEAGKEPCGVIRDPKLNETISFRVSDRLAVLAREMHSVR